MRKRDAYYKHVQSAWPMHPFNPIQLNVRGSGWTRYERDGPLMLKNRIAQACNSLWDEPHDLLFIHDTEMVVGDQRDSTAALVWPIVQHDSARLGDAKRTACKYAITCIKLLVGECVVVI